MVISRIRLDGLIYSLESLLKSNMCQGLQIFALVYIYIPTQVKSFRLFDSDFGITPVDGIAIGIT